jgi:3-methylcrotonyl-CoA carboxylase alpha subunit
MVELRDDNGRLWQINIGTTEAVCDGDLISNEHTFEIDARPNRLWVDGQLAHVIKVRDDWWIHIDGCIHVLSIDEQGPSGSGDEGGMTAPMPGKILEILCSIGDQVESGQTLIVMEAMKMEHRIAANGPGSIVAIHHEVGQQVDAGATLIDIEDSE